jgi:hypothetical protein
MAVSPPSRGKPPHPAAEEQVKPGPLVEAPKIPQMAPISKQKFTAGKLSGRVLRVGKGK